MKNKIHLFIGSVGATIGLFVFLAYIPQIIFNLNGDGSSQTLVGNGQFLLANLVSVIAGDGYIAEIDSLFALVGVNNSQDNTGKIHILRNIGSDGFDGGFDIHRGVLPETE